MIRQILALISLALELDEDALWNLHDHRDPIGESCQRYMAYYPRSEDEEQVTSGVWSKGHTDCTIYRDFSLDTLTANPGKLIDNTISLPFSQPIAALQILTPAQEWKWVKHVEGAAVVNVADALDC